MRLRKQIAQPPNDVSGDMRNLWPPLGMAPHAKILGPAYIKHVVPDILLLILGAALGVVVDRLYRRFVESAPKVAIKSSASFGINGERFNLVITNIGLTPLPPYEIFLRHPKAGSFQTFWSE